MLRLPGCSSSHYPSERCGGRSIVRAFQSNPDGPMDKPFRADQVGSLLRPPELKAARERRAKNEISAAELRAVEDRFIKEAVVKQEATGMQAITDGDFRRTSWSGD